MNAKWIILVNVSIGIFMSTLDASIVNVALPQIAKEMAVSLDNIQWVVSAYLLTISGLMLIFGKLSDMYGRRNIYATGFVTFAAGSLMCGVSRSLGVLVLSRVVQAVGAAVMMANGQAIVTATFPQKERGRALGITGMVVALGNMTGPSLGGFLTDFYGWPSIFLINIPIGIIGGLLSLRYIPLAGTKKGPGEFDRAGSITFVAGVVLLFFALLSLPESAIPPAALWTMFSLAVVLLAAFIYIQSRAKFPLIHLGLFKNSVFTLGISAGYISFLTMTAVTILIPFYLQDFRGLSPRDSGLIMTAYPIALALVAPVSGYLSDLIGYRWLTAGGMLASTLGLVSMTTITPLSPVWSIFARLTLMGVGNGMFQSPNNSSIMSSAPREHLGVASSINNLVRNLGMISGITFATTLFTLQMNRFIRMFPPEKAREFFVPAMSRVFAIASVIAALGVILTLVRARSHSQTERV